MYRMDPDRIRDAAAVIRIALEPHADPEEFGCTIQQALQKHSAAYRNGLTNAETRLALIQALSEMAIQAQHDFAALLWESTE